jgi:triosephosphate isomerase
MKIMKLLHVLVNFKNYKEATGKNALILAKICEKISEKYKITIGVAPQFIDLQKVREEVKIPVFSQHIDPIEKAGAFTGHVVAENLKAIGIDGTLINHSERKLPLKDVEKCVEIAKKFELISVCCAATLEEAEKIAKFNPDFIAYEDPLLIGTGQAISKVKPESVKEFVKKLYEINPNVIPLCGAGISSGEDVKAAIELGTKGILVSSAVVKSNNPQSILTGMAKYIKKVTSYPL